MRSIVSLCANLGIETIGEMVEDQPSADFLLEIGVRYGQGFLFGRPTRDISGWRPSENRGLAKKAS